MHSGKLLDGFDVIFAIVVNQIYIRKNSFSFICKTCQSAFRYLVCIWICGSFGPRPPHTPAPCPADAFLGLGLPAD